MMPVRLGRRKIRSRSEGGTMQREDPPQEMPVTEQGEVPETPGTEAVPEEAPARDPQSEGMPEGEQGETQTDDSASEETTKDIEAAFE
jgi:hypothetical protein